MSVKVTPTCAQANRFGWFFVAVTDSSAFFRGEKLCFVLVTNCLVNSDYTHSRALGRSTIRSDLVDDYGVFMFEVAHRLSKNRKRTHCLSIDTRQHRAKNQYQRNAGEMIDS